MKVLLVVPEIRLNDKPFEFPFWAGILASIVENKGGDVAILDLNALRMNYGGGFVPTKIIKEELATEKWDLIGVGGLTTTYGRLKQLIPLIRQVNPDSMLIAGGGWCSYNPDEILDLIPEINMICIGEGEETFSEIYDEIQNKTFDFENVKGICINNNGEKKYTEPRALISNLDTVPVPHYDLFETDIYFKYSSYPYSRESFNSKRRASAVWERGCPRGCTFCSHNGMSRIDLQNIYGKGDKKQGELVVREVDKKNNTFQMPARWPTPEYAVNNVKMLKEKFDIDFITIEDENMTSNLKWTREFCELYIKEGLNKTVKWGTLGDAPSVAVKPEILQIMVEAGCTYISFGFESASNKVLNEDIKKGQTRKHLATTINEIRKVELRPLATFMIGNPNEDINDLMETLEFWLEFDIEVDPFICTPYVGSPIFYNHKDRVLEQYDERLKLAKNNPKIDQKTIKKWQLAALDRFMTECGDATAYTATVSKNFTISELYAIKRFMYTKDPERLLRMAHERFEQTGQKQWMHDEKWKKYCAICKANDEIFPSIEITKN